ncbi:MAG TPA: Gfo/Idh/MocA family oxidoreductase [Gemmatimonadales bacterium]|nr:Gfo/Idh/MocA family oxidoreductase [Gemmatimonadales bacterium]
MAPLLGIGLIGQQFMGRAHSNAWGQVGRFFDLPVGPRLVAISARNPVTLGPFALRWGFERYTTDWRLLAHDPEIQLVDVATPNHVHAEQAIAMLEAGKHVACEKPLAGTLADARSMRDAARRSKSRTFVWFNYRRCPAIGLAWGLIRDGALGRIHHLRARYLQSWGGKDTPLLWRFRKGEAGSGAHGDLNAHSIDLARFLSGQEVTSVNGAVARTFITRRRVAGTRKTGRSTVDDATLFLATMSGGAVASFECSRVATGHLNDNTIELNGELGSVRFSFEDMNVLEYFDATLPKGTQGWRRIMASTAGEHPYVANWWPEAHLLGYEHTFVNMAADVLRVLGRRRPELPLPDFADAYETQRVLEAAMISAKSGCAVPMREVK